VNDVTYWKNCVKQLMPNTGTFASLSFTKYSHTMGNLLYIISAIMSAGWAIGFLNYHAGGPIHVLLVIAMVALILRVVEGKNREDTTSFLQTGALNQTAHRI
jgi:hypothetical protein